MTSILSKLWVGYQPSFYLTDQQHLTWLLLYFWNTAFIKFCSSEILFSSGHLLISTDGLFSFCWRKFWMVTLDCALLNFFSKFIVSLWVIIFQWSWHLERNNFKFYLHPRSFPWSLDINTAHISNVSCLKAIFSAVFPCRVVSPIC